MNATELFKAGRLSDAIAAQVQEVRSHPTDQNRRLFLFELLAFSGDLERARKQIDALDYQEPSLQNAAAQLRALLDAEGHRRKVFAEGISPEFFGEPTPDMKLRLEAIGHLRLGQPTEAAKLIHEANALLPHIRGQFNGSDFDGFRDADDLLAGVLEVMAQGRYYWVGLGQVLSVAANPPRFPRDTLYFPARLELEDQAGEVFLPTLYPGSYAHEDEQVRLGRVTDWKEVEGEVVLGVGSHDFLVGEQPVGLLEWRQLVFETNPGAGE